MKKNTWLALGLALCLVISLFGCAKKNESPTDRQEDAYEVPLEQDEQEASTQGEQEPEQEQPAPQTPAKDKTVLKIAGVGCSESKIKMVINEFNKTDSDYSVTLMDCGFGTTSDRGKMNLQTQIMAGKRPDMLLFDKQVYYTSGDDRNALSPLPYIAQGMLLDLDNFMENDPALSPEDFVIWDALHEFGGMYVIGPTFNLNAMCCLPETAERYQNWTLDDYLALQASMTGEIKPMSIRPAYFLELSSNCYIHEALDVENAVCDFNNPKFISILEAANQIVEYNVEMMRDNFQSFKGAPEMLMDGELTFYWTNLCSAFDVSFDRYRTGVRLWYGEGENPYEGKLEMIDSPLSYIGFPTPDGSNGISVDFAYTVGVCAGTKQEEGCWEFIKYMLAHPVLQDMQDDTPVLESKQTESFEMIQKGLAQDPWTLTKEDQEVFLAAARQSTVMSYYDYDILSIIAEEAEAYFAGGITVQEAVERIQNRASVLVMEQYG